MHHMRFRKIRKIHQTKLLIKDDLIGKIRQCIFKSMIHMNNGKKYIIDMHKQV